jgi:type I restriction enzyme S subunit
MSLIPETWVRCLIGEVAQIRGGGTPPSKDPTNFTLEGGFPWITPADLSGYKEKYISHGARYLTEKGLRSSSAKLMPTGSVLFSSRAPVGYVVIAANEITTSQGFKSFVLPKELDSSYIYYFLRFIKPIAESMATGTTFKELSGSKASQLPVIVAPFNEQKCIADKLDTVFVRMDACREHLDRVPEILKRFRQAVLAAASSGRLTEEWRGARGNTIKSWKSTISTEGISLPENYTRLGKIEFKLRKIEFSSGKLPDTWALMTIADLYNLNVLIDFADGNHGAMYPRKEEFTKEGALFLTASQIGENWEINIQACPRLRSDKAELLLKGWAQNYDVLLTHNATVGRVALLEYDKEKVLLGTSVTFYRFNKDYVSPNFARILFSSPFFQNQLIMEMAQTTRNQVPITKQVSLNFICPPIEEQLEIVRRVGILFTYAVHLESRYKAARNLVDKMTPALLAKAFRGELVPQNPNDEPATMLLKRIRSDREVIDIKDKYWRQPANKKNPMKVRGNMRKIAEIKPTHLSDILKEQGPLTAESLWAASGLEIDNFYNQLKDEELKGFLKELRNTMDDLVSILEAI